MTAIEMLLRRPVLGVAGAALLWAGGASVAGATAPCGDLGECRVLIEINASDGDIGFHVLFDGEGWRDARITDPRGRKIFKERPSRSLRAQKLTENFFESAEPVCEEELAEDEDEEVVTLPEFLQRFPAGSYGFRLKGDRGERQEGETTLTHNLPAAPAEVDFDGTEITWEYGDDLGECTTVPDGFEVAPESDIAGYEVVMAPDVEELSDFTFSVRVPANGPAYAVTVPAEYLASLPPNTPLKVEVGAIELRPDGSLGNQTFTEEDGFSTGP